MTGSVVWGNGTAPAEQSAIAAQAGTGATGGGAPRMAGTRPSAAAHAVPQEIVGSAVPDSHCGRKPQVRT